MRIKVTLIAMAIVALVSIGSAQNGQGGGGGGRGGFGQRGGGAQRLTQLLRNPQVQTELKLTDDQKAKIDALPRPQRGGGGGGGGTPPTAEEMAKAAADDKAASVAILTPEQETRLEQIRIQWAGPAALAMPEVQAGLALTDDQKAKLKDLQTKMADANRALFAKMQNQEIERDAGMATMQANQATYKTEVDKILTDDQKAKLKAMGGAELKRENARPGGR